MFERTQPVICAGARTPIGRFGGALVDTDSEPWGLNQYELGSGANAVTFARSLVG